MQNGKEHFTRAIDFKRPEYCPSLIGVNFNFLYEKDKRKQEMIISLLDRIGNNEIVSMRCWKDKRWTENGVNYWENEWGTRRVDTGVGFHPQYFPMGEGYEYIDRVNFPDASDETRFMEADRILQNRNGRYMIGKVGHTLFERLWMLRGFDNMLMDPYVDEENFLILKQRVMDVNLAMIDKWLDRDVDGISFSDDWGHQRDLLINPQDWRKYYKNDYINMFSRIHRAGKHVWMHLCGNIIAILPDLIEIGLNVLNPVQPQAMDVNYLAKEFGGKVCFNGGIDVQGTMIKGSPKDVKNEVMHLIEIFGCYNGGYIINTSHTIMPETPLDNVIALLEAILEYR